MFCIFYFTVKDVMCLNIHYLWSVTTNKFVFDELVDQL